MTAHLKHPIRCSFLAALGPSVPPALLPHSSGSCPFKSRAAFKIIIISSFTIAHEGRDHWGGVRADQCSTRAAYDTAEHCNPSGRCLAPASFSFSPSCSSREIAPSGAVIWVNILSRAIARPSLDIFQIKAKIISGVAPCVCAFARTRDARLSKSGRISHLPYSEPGLKRHLSGVRGER